MSHVVAIGLAASGPVPELLSALEHEGFRLAESESLREAEFVSELKGVIGEIRPDFFWLLRVSPDDVGVDLNFVYELVGSVRGGGLGVFIERANQSSSLRRVGVLLYDLSDTDVLVMPQLPLARLADDLSSRYPQGGPVGSVFHEFVRGEGALEVVTDEEN
jgi:hypothetical protein